MRGRKWAGLALGMLAFWSLAALAVDPKTEYDKKIKSAQDVEVLGADLAGDQTSVYTGSTEFVATDVSVSGNDGLSVAVGRRYPVEKDHMSAQDYTGYDVPLLRAFGDWDMDIPYLSGVFSEQNGWDIDST